MYSAKEFVIWALSHAKRENYLETAKLPVPVSKVGTEPWHYLFGSVRVRTTKAAIESYWKNHYSQKGWPREQYDGYTNGWRETDYATDCEGLLDAWLTYECGQKTDINADMNYKQWCTDVCGIGATERPYVVGEALFSVNSKGKATHIGWICGCDETGEPLAVEARGIAYGVVVTRMRQRAWTHRGLMTKMFSYDEANESEEKPMAQTIFEKTSPMKTGDAFKKMQAALNAAGYTDAKGRRLEEDGKWGTNSQAAFDKLTAAHAPAAPKEDKPAEGVKPVNESAVYLTSEDGKYELKLTITEAK